MLVKGRNTHIKKFLGAASLFILISANSTLASPTCEQLSNARVAIDMATVERGLFDDGTQRDAAESERIQCNNALPADDYAGQQYCDDVYDRAIYDINATVAALDFAIEDAQNYLNELLSALTEPC